MSETNEAEKETLSENFIVEIGLFSQCVMFHFGDTELLQEQLEKRIGEAASKEVLKDVKTNDKLGTTYTLSDDILVYMPNIPKTEKDYGVLAHEILHAVFKVTEKVGIDYSPEGEEIYTYLMQYLMQAVLETLHEADTTS